jgi:hypothetical protein
VDKEKPRICRAFLRMSRGGLEPPTIGLKVHTTVDQAGVSATNREQILLHLGPMFEQRRPTTSKREHPWR